MIARRSKELPHVIDLFSGCGGMSLGFSDAGFPLLASVDIDKAASKTAVYNLDHRAGTSEYEHKSYTGDMIIPIIGYICT